MGWLLPWLVLPALALHQLRADISPLWTGGWVGLASVFTLLTYGADKYLAQAGGRRVPEVTLHLLAAVGGWPGAFLGRQIFRHKTVKQPFTAIFWLVGLTQQAVALDCLRGGPWLRAALGWLPH